jgi:acetoin utilization deacetylase AcuC-like enzyme
MVTALKLLATGECKRIAIIDADQHYGNGTDDIIRRVKPVGIKHLTFGQYFHAPNHAGAYLSKMREACLALRRRPPDLVIYQAGADAHRDDPLGGVLSTEEMYARDLMIFEACAVAKIPIAWNLAGGYQDVEKIVEIHMNTFKAAVTGHWCGQEEGR